MKCDQKTNTDQHVLELYRALENTRTEVSDKSKSEAHVYKTTGSLPPPQESLPTELSLKKKNALIPLARRRRDWSVLNPLANFGLLLPRSQENLAQPLGSRLLISPRQATF